MTWWRDFFDASYRALWGHLHPPSRTARELDVLRALLGDTPTRVLDVCCGDARIAHPLALHGPHTVTAVDASRDQLLAVPTPWPEALSLVQADARALPFRDAFDVALVLQSSLGFFDTDDAQQAMFDAIAHALVPGGRLILDTIHRDTAATRHGERLWFEPEPDRGPICHAFDFDPLSGRSHESVSWFEGGVMHRKSWSCRIYTLTELERMLTRAGLSLELTAADFDPDAVASPHAERLFLVARRNTHDAGSAIHSGVCCPLNGAPLHDASMHVVKQLNARIAAGHLRDRSNQPIIQPLDAALLRDDHAFAYPIRDALPCLLPEAALPCPEEDDDDAL